MRLIQLVFVFVTCILISISAFSFERPNVLIFVSFSMPKQSLKLWLHDAYFIKSPVIIRGLLNNSFKDTTHAMADLVKDNPSGIQIDPELFKKYHIQKVPAVVVTNANGDFSVIYGDVTLDYALHIIAQQNDQLSNIAENALLKLKEAQHG